MFNKPLLTNSETMRNPNKTKTKRTKGIKYLPLNIREMIGFRSRTSQSTVNNGTPLQNFDSTQPYITSTGNTLRAQPGTGT